MAGSARLGVMEEEKQELAQVWERMWHGGRWKGDVGGWWQGLDFSPFPDGAPVLCVSLDFRFGKSSTPPFPNRPLHTGEADSPPSTRIEKGATCVRIIFCPTLQDQSAFSSSGIMADFMVQYDVVMEDIIGDVQVLGMNMGSEVGQVCPMPCSLQLFL